MQRKKNLKLFKILCVSDVYSVCYGSCSVWVFCPFLFVGKEDSITFLYQEEGY